MTRQFTPLGDTLLTITLGEGTSEELSAIVVENARTVAEADIIGVTDVVPAYAAVGVHYDPRVITFDDLRDRIAALPATRGNTSNADASRLHTVTVKYDGADIEEVADRTGLTVHGVVDIHSSAEYRVYVIGFVPGFAYLGQLDERLALPRRASPRPRVPPGSVAIADRQTAIYPSATPGGWHTIGTTAIDLFDPSRESPSRFRVGDRVRFVPG